jgi:hypothetical protein
MINSGGMVIISLIKSDSIIADRFDFVSKCFYLILGMLYVYVYKSHHKFPITIHNIIFYHWKNKIKF